MQQKNKKIGAIIFWILSAIAMIIIFYFSSQTADESVVQSGGILEWINKILGDNAVSQFIVRKCAHFIEFTGLAFLLNFALYFTKNKKQYILATSITSLYAISDEVHQIFVEGRACQFRDWLIDTCGALLAVLICVIIFAIIEKFSKKKKIMIDNDNSQ